VQSGTILLSHCIHLAKCCTHGGVSRICVANSFALCVTKHTYIQKLICLRKLAAFDSNYKILPKLFEFGFNFIILHKLLEFDQNSIFCGNLFDFEF
jgi:hypothetical protein